MGRIATMVYCVQQAGGGMALQPKRMMRSLTR